MKGWQPTQLWRKRPKQSIKTWYLILALGMSLLANVYLLRQNNLTMVALRNQVVWADETQTDVAGALTRLNQHVFNHMNTQLVRPVELVHTYNRQAQAAIEAAHRGSGRDVYAEAAAACERRGVPLTSIAQCAADYATANDPGVGPKQITLPDKNLFIYSFATPRWTADLAGLSLLVTGVIIIWLTGRGLASLIVWWVTRRRAKTSF